MDGLLLCALGVFLADVIFNVYDHGHYRTEQSLYDREFRGIVENYV